jgi:hypothetical protein
MLASITKEEPCRCASPVNEEVGLKGLAEGVGGSDVVASDLDGLGGLWKVGSSRFLMSL